jgi:hypothetical protein
MSGSKDNSALQIVKKFYPCPLRAFKILERLRALETASKSFIPIMINQKRYESSYGEQRASNP